VASLAQPLEDFVLGLARSAAEAAVDQAAGVSQAVDRLLAQGGDALQAIKQATSPPDWSTLLCFALVRLVEEIGDPRVTMGVRPAEAGWSKAVSLRFTDSVSPLPALQIALALFGPGTHGVRVLAERPMSLNVSGDAVTLKLQSAGAGRCDVPLTGPIAYGGALGLTCATTVTPPRNDITPPGLAAPKLILGPLVATVVLKAGPPSWDLTVSLGAPGVDLGVIVANPADLLGRELSGVLDFALPQLSFIPTLHVRSGAAPTFDFGQRSA